ncbi:MAG: rhodanese-like domain-containing protein [Gammaproteobacteria bacterium]|nr:rhodanese-like domain-containing protein [Gammaproteobacteria bacterium]
MIKNTPYLIYLLLLIITLTSTSNVFARCKANDKLPLREVFLDSNCISTQELVKKMNRKEVIIIDTRTKAEFDVLKIKRAINIDFDNKKIFKKKIEKLRLFDKRDIVFYCNGTQCTLSYRAEEQAKKMGIKNTYVYDQGILNFALAEPKKILLFNNTVSEANQIISLTKLNQHALNSASFEAQITQHIINKEAFNILDIRDRTSRNGSSIFVGVGHEKYIPLNRITKLKKYLKKIAQKNEPLYIYDWAGLKLRWVQYYIEQENIKEYYFLKDGAFNKVNSDLAKIGLPALPY